MVCAIEPDGTYICNNSEIRIQDSRVVTEVNYDYDYTASIDKSNGGGFLTGHTYNTGNAYTPSDSINEYLNYSYVEFAATLTPEDVTCNKTKHEYGCDVFQAVYCYKDTDKNSINKRVFSFNVVNNSWNMNVYDVTDYPGDNQKVKSVYSTTGSAFSADSAEAVYRFTSTETGVIFTRNDEQIISWNTPIQQTLTETVIAPKPESMTDAIYNHIISNMKDEAIKLGYIQEFTFEFDVLNATLGKYAPNADDGVPYEGAEVKEYDFVLANQAGYIMWRPLSEDGSFAGEPAMAMYLDDGLIIPDGPLVPEPGTATLSLLALAGLAARRRRK